MSLCEAFATPYHLCPADRPACASCGAELGRVDTGRIWRFALCDCGAEYLALELDAHGPRPGVALFRISAAERRRLRALVAGMIAKTYRPPAA